MIFNCSKESFFVSDLAQKKIMTIQRKVKEQSIQGGKIVVVFLFANMFNQLKSILRNVKLVNYDIISDKRPS